MRISEPGSGPSGSAAVDWTARAVRAATEVAAAHGLRVGEPVVLADLYSVVVHLAPAPVVVRIPTLTGLIRDSGERWRAREIEVVSYLHAQGMPVVPPSDELPPGPHCHDGLVLSFWQYVTLEPDRQPTPEETGSLLAELHTALCGFPGELPVLAPPANDIPRCLEMLADSDWLNAGDVDLLRAAYQRMAPLVLEPQPPLQPLHGDGHPGNLLPTTDGLLWTDFEDVCLGPVAWDLANLALIAPQALAAYPDAPEPQSIRPYRDLRMLHITCWLAAVPRPRGLPKEQRAQMLSSLMDHWRVES